MLLTLSETHINQTGQSSNEGCEVENEPPPAIRKNLGSDILTIKTKGTLKTSKSLQISIAVVSFYSDNSCQIGQVPEGFLQWVVKEVFLREVICNLNNEGQRRESTYAASPNFLV